MAQAKTEFAGVWKCTAAEGMGDLLKEVGVAWLMRKAAAAFGYGVNKQMVTITQDGDKLHIVSKGKETKTTDLVVGTTQQLPGRQEGETVPATSRWVADGALELVLASRCPPCLLNASHTMHTYCPPSRHALPWLAWPSLRLSVGAGHGDDGKEGQDHSPSQIQRRDVSGDCRRRGCCHPHVHEAKREVMVP